MQTLSLTGSVTPADYFSCLACSSSLHKMAHWSRSVILLMWPQDQEYQHSPGTCQRQILGHHRRHTEVHLGWVPAICVGTSPPRDSDTQQKLRAASLNQLFSAWLHIKITQAAFITYQSWAVPAKDSDLNDLWWDPDIVNMVLIDISMSSEVCYNRKSVSKCKCIHPDVQHS